jgi:hypothetical protein
VRILPVVAIRKQVFRFKSHAARQTAKSRCQGETGSSGSPPYVIGYDFIRTATRFFIAARLGAPDDLGNVFVWDPGKSPRRFTKDSLRGLTPADIKMVQKFCQYVHSIRIITLFNGKFYNFRQTGFY